MKINSIGDSALSQINSHLAVQQMHEASYGRVIETKDICAPVLDSPTDLSCFQQFLRLVVIFSNASLKLTEIERYIGI